MSTYMRAAVCWLVVVSLLGCEPPEQEVDEMVPINISGRGGVNLRRSPDQIRDDELEMSKNLIPRGESGFVKRPSLQYVSEISPDTYYPLSLAFPPRETGGVAVVATYQSGLTQTRLLALTSSASVTVSEFPERGLRPAMMSFGNKLYIFPGYPSTSLKTFEWDAGLGFPVFRAAAFAGAGNAGLSPRVAGRYRSRAVYGNFGPGFERHLVFSDNFTPLTIGDSALTSRAIFVGDDGDRIVAVQEVMTTGAEIQASLLVLLQYSAFIVTGEPNQSTGSGDPFESLVVQRVPYRTGCASAETVAVTPHGTFWASPDGVWGFRAGQGVFSVGDKIRPALLRTPDSMKYRWTAAYHNGYYRLAVFGEDQSPSDTEPLGDQWWLSLETPPTNDEDARWFGPQQYKLWDGSSVQNGTYTMAVDTRPGADTGLYGVDTSTDTLGNRALALLSYGNAAERDSASSPDPDITSIAGTEITMDLRAKRYGLGVREAPLSKTFWKGEATVYTTKHGRLTFEADSDRGTQIDTVNVDINKYGLATGEPLDGSTMSERIQAVAFWPDPATRQPFQSFQFKLRDNTGFVIAAGINDTLYFTDVLASQLYSATIPAGYYATMTALLNALLIKMNVAIAGMGLSDWTYSRGGLISFTSTGVSWAFNFVEGGGVTSTQAQVSAALGSLLGFNVGANVSGVSTVTAAERVYEVDVPRWEVHAMNAFIRVTGRRPQ